MLRFPLSAVESLTCHLDPLGLRDIAPDGICDAGAWIIDFHDPKGLRPLTAGDRLTMIKGAVQFARRYSYEVKKITVVRPEGGEEDEEAFGQTMDQIVKVPDGRNRNDREMSWAFLERGPDADGLVRCKCCKRE